MKSESPPARAAPRISFEFFPPRTPRASMALWGPWRKEFEALGPLPPGRGAALPDYNLRGDVPPVDDRQFGHVCVPGAVFDRPLHRPARI